MQFWFFVLVMSLSLVSPVSAHSDGADQVDYGEISLLKDYDNREDKRGHVDFGPLSRGMDAYLGVKKSRFQEHGFNYIVEIAPQYQDHIDGGGGSTANNETNLIAQWSLVDAEEPKRGNLLMWYQWSDTWGSDTTSDFSQAIGVLSPPNGGDTAPQSSRNLTQHFAWEQWFSDDQWRFMIGKLTTRVLFNLNRFTVSDREDFFTPMLVNNPVTHYTARVGFGAFVEHRQDSWYISGMVRDADADLSKKFIDFGSLDTGNWEYVTEVGLTPDDVKGLGEGNYRLTFSYSDATDNLEATRSISLSVDQDLGEKWGAFVRYAWADDTYRAFEQRLALGIQALKPLGFTNDRAGIAAWWGKPTDSSLDDEYGLDMFWKLQVSPWLELTPGLQLNLNPAIQTDRSSAVIAQVRLRMVL